MFSIVDRYGFFEIENRSGLFNLPNEYHQMVSIYDQLRCKAELAKQKLKDDQELSRSLMNNLIGGAR